jgi:hypothetical protein
MADLRLPFNYTPGMYMPPEQLQANFDFIRQLIADLDSRVTAFTGISVSGTLSAGTASITGTASAASLTASSTLQVGSAGATLDASASTGQVKQSGQTSFAAILPSAVGGVNETGNLDPILYTNTDFNTNSSYNTSTGTFTAPVAGKYLFIATADVAARGGTPATVFALSLVATGATYTAREIPNSTNRQTMQITALVNMAANDTAKVRLAVGSSSELWNIANSITSFFTGSLIN